MCRLGMAAYWFEIEAIASESNDHGPPYSASVSTNPNVPSAPRSELSRHAPPNWVGASSPICGSGHGASSRRGGISGKNANPMIASAVIAASVLRHCGNTSARLMNSSTNTPSVIPKWAVP